MECQEIKLSEAKKALLDILMVEFISNSIGTQAAKVMDAMVRLPVSETLDTMICGNLMLSEDLSNRLILLQQEPSSELQQSIASLSLTHWYAQLMGRLMEKDTDENILEVTKSLKVETNKRAN